ncbi:MAG TPA: phosphatase PAP2 family protein [Vicinamibacterales bacterium]|jgi:membrane-associated phospholipid phosphatase|nr:phosphatase PAP2 family protein [Vicinamibacterales bacterium]
MNVGAVVLIAILSARMLQPSVPAEPSSSSSSSITGLPARVVHDAAKLASRTPLVTLAIGGVAAAAVHPADASIEQRIPKFGTVDEAVDAGSALGDGWVQWTVASVVYGTGLVLKKPAVADVGTRLVEAQVVGGVLTQLIKYAADRERPNGGHLSFPSGHSEASFVTADILEQHYGWRVGAFAYFAAGCVSLSRLAEHEHYASDVVFGAAVGIAAARATGLAHGGRRAPTLGGFTIVPVVTGGSVGMLVTRLGGRHAAAVDKEVAW